MAQAVGAVEYTDCYILISDSCRNIHIYAGYIPTQEDFFTNIFTSHFIARVRKGCSRFACERVLETEHKLHILTPLL